MIAESGHKAAHVEPGDANVVLLDICQPRKWTKRRGVIFLDPFGMGVNWTTLQTIAATRALDVWYLFALSGTIRNLPLRLSGLDHDKRAAVTRVLGTDGWIDEFYSARSTPLEDLAGHAAPSLPKHRVVDLDGLQDYVHRRLDSIFAHVEPPKRLTASGNKSLFSLFFAVSNPDRRAITLAQRGAAHILKNA